MPLSEAVITVRLDPEQIAEIKADIERQIQEALEADRREMMRILARYQPVIGA